MREEEKVEETTKEEVEENTEEKVKEHQEEEKKDLRALHFFLVSLVSGGSIETSLEVQRYIHMGRAAGGDGHGLIDGQLFL